jgi:hypothetical protein
MMKKNHCFPPSPTIKSTYYSQEEVDILVKKAKRPKVLLIGFFIGCGTANIITIILFLINKF